MFPWILFWSPQLYFPWSGDVTQAIESLAKLNAIRSRIESNKLEEGSLPLLPRIRALK